MPQPIELIVGLGNPDPRYLNTRHNAGFWFVDVLARDHGVRFGAAKKLHGDSCEVQIETQRIRLLKPMTYMNHSGQAVGAAASYFKIPAGNVLVVYDELDLPPGTARLKFDGGDAGHNGVRSVTSHIGRDFWRLRLGVGHPGDKERVVGHVLDHADDEDRAAILDSIRRGIEILPTLITQGGDRAQNILHARRESSEADPEDQPNGS
jgi:PTH1 family peptidyl-tRNA hydrolase